MTRGRGFILSAPGATLVYLALTAVLTWPLVSRADRDIPGDLLDPLFTTWALGWNFRAFGLAQHGPGAASYWDANIFYPTSRALARSEHFFPQALQGAPVYALTHNLVLTHNVVFLSTFVLSGLFFYLLARDDTGDRCAALAGGLFYAFALYRWGQVGHLGALSSHWMPLSLLLARRVAQATQPGAAARWIVAFAVVTAAQLLSSAYYLLFFPLFLGIWAAFEARRCPGAGSWLRLGAGGALAAAMAAPLVLPFATLRAAGAQRDLASVIPHSADLLSFLTAPSTSVLWGALDLFPRGEARLFPGLVTPFLAIVGLAAGARAAWATGRATAAHMRVPFSGLVGWVRLRGALCALLHRREVLPIVLSMLAAWLALGPVVTWRGWPTNVAAAYRWLYDYVPGFSAVRAPGRFAMIAACFGALAASWGLKHLRSDRRGRTAAWLLTLAFVLETAAVPMPLSIEYPVEGTSALPAWTGGPSPIVDAVLALPDEAVLAVLPFSEIFHETRAMFDAAHHGRRLLNGYSSWMPLEHTQHAVALRDPLRHAPEVVQWLGAAGATHILVHEAAWMRDKGPRVTERLIAAGARPVSRAGDVVLLAVPSRPWRTQDGQAWR